MLDKFKYFLKHSIIYSISNVATKASGIILLPIYTSYFTVEEFGRLGLVLAIITILIQIVVLGQNQSILKFNNQIEYVDKKKINSLYSFRIRNSFNTCFYCNRRICRSVVSKNFRKL